MRPPLGLAGSHAFRASLQAREIRHRIRRLLRRLPLQQPLRHQRRELRILGSYGARTRTDMPEIIRLAAQGIFRPESIVTERFPLDQADAAYQKLARGEIVGRAIVIP